MGVYWATAAILLPYLVVAWFLGTWLRLQGSSLWILRGGLALLGVLAAVAFFFFYRKVVAQKEAASDDENASEDTQDVDNLVHDAVRKLRGSSLGRGATLGKLPVVFLLGDSGSAKTHTIINSGLDPELLAGHVYQDNQILPTQIANFWYTRHAIFADIAGSMLHEGKKWSRLVRLLQPGRISSAVQQGQQAPRAVIVCFECGRFLEQGASETATAAARLLGARLQQISQMLGISVPVYVLFTKIDRLSFFSEYVRNFNKDEANAVLGATLPVRPAHSAGVYADEETRRLEKAFDELFYSLSDRRMELLLREHEGDKRALVYEFPRELKKTRKLLVSFLVDMARPSQLQVNPFLRGFYFSGVRPIVIDDVIAATPNEYALSAEPDEGATRIFNAGSRGPQPVAQRVAGSRKVPQWVFLSQFFNGVLLKDQVAFRASGFSTRVSALRRVALALAAAIGFLLAIFFAVSFIQNRALENQLANAAREIPTVHVTGGQLVSASDLQPLERLRSVVVRLRNYEENGPPWHMRWGLYVGSDLFPGARRLYFQRFDEMLFRQTQGNIVNALRTLKDKPGAGDNYDKPYSELKAYLITTSNPDKSTVDFLSPVLLAHWTNGRDVDPERADLAHKQFDFYSSELLKGNPFSSQNDPRLIAQARNYLVQFQAIELYYRPLLAEAEKHAPAISFNDQFKESASVLVSSYRVRGAFTQAGAAFLKDALRQPNRYVSGEAWVLGPIAQQLDPSALAQKLSERYTQDYLAEWRTVVQKAQVQKYASGDLSDADAKLGILTSPTSPLLEFFWFVSENTNVDNPAIKDTFQPATTVVPPGPPDKYRLPSNEGYIAALSGLQAAISTIEKSPSISDPSATKPVLDAAGEAHKAVNKLAGSFRVDPQGGIEKSVQQLLEQPIIYAEDLFRQSADKVNRAGAGFCAQFGQLSGKFPFNPNATAEISIAQLDQLLKPNTGALWTFYSSTLAPLLVKDGARYTAAAGPIQVTPHFLEFFNRAVSLSDALYPSGSPTPHLAFTLKALPSNLEGFVLKIGNDTLATTDPAKTFYWTGGGENVEVTSKGGDAVETDQGTWGVFRFMMSAHWTGADLEWISQSNGRNVLLPNGKLKSFRYELQVPGANPLRPGELSSLHCVSQVAH